MSGATHWTRIRLIACGVAFGVLFAAIGKRAFNLQIGQGERLKVMAEEQYLREIELPPRRGRILDRNGAELASTADVDSIYCNPRRFADAHDAARQLSRVLGLDARDLEKRLAQRRYFAWVKRKVTPDEVTAVRALELPGVAFTREPRRFYPNRGLAATVLGTAGSDGRGLDGVELAFDAYLRGSASSVQGVRDALGRELFVESAADTASGAGSDVVLTLDRYLTFITERAIADAAARHHAKAVVAVMMDPQTGEVLAMASVPSFNPNDAAGAAEAGARDRAITDTFEPGSTMKTFTIAAALDAGVVRPEDRFDCLMGRMNVGKYTIHDTHAHGILTVAEVFKFSSNIGATKIARRLGRERLAEALDRYGFGHPTDIGLPGERSGVVRPVEKWGDIGFANISFGHGIAVTPLQVIAGVSSIAAGGVYHQPRIVSRVVSPEGAVETPRRRGGAARDVGGHGACHGWHHARRDRDRRHRSPGGDRRLSSGRKDRHGAEGDRRALRSAEVRGVVRRVRAGAEPAHRAHRDDGRAGGGPPRRRGRGAGVQGDRRAGAALSARAAGRAGGRERGGRQRGGGRGAGRRRRCRRRARSRTPPPTTTTRRRGDLPPTDATGRRRRRGARRRFRAGVGRGRGGRGRAFRRCGRQDQCAGQPA